MRALGYRGIERSREHGFTMAELLIVVAIVAVLVAIAIPVFSAQLEKSREAVDLANARSAYAILQTTKIDGTRPDGSKADGSEAGNGFYLYTGSQFTMYRNGVQPSADSVIKMKSENVDLTDIFGNEINILRDTGYVSSWKDCVIVVSYADSTGIDSVLLQPAAWFTFSS